MSEARRIARILRQGGVALLPTDTVYGLAARPEHDAAVARIFALKRRPAHRNLPVMVDRPVRAGVLGIKVTIAARRLLDSAYVPGPLTIVFEVDPKRAAPWLADREEVAIRIPRHDLMQDVLWRAGPLLVTSANAHGLATPESLADALAQLDGAPDIAIDGGILSATPSTLVNCRRDPPAIERVGAVPAAAIEALLA